MRGRTSTQGQTGEHMWVCETQAAEHESYTAMSRISNENGTRKQKFGCLVHVQQVELGAYTPGVKG